MTRATIRAATLALVLAGPLATASSARAQTLCEELHGLAPGEARTVWATLAQAHVGAGWNFAPAGALNRAGGGPVRELAVSVDRTRAVFRCTADGDAEIDLRPGGLRIGASMSDAFWSDFAMVSVHAGYLRTGAAVRYWIAPAVSGLGISPDSAGVGIGVKLGAGLFEWVALHAHPQLVIAGRGTFDGGSNVSVAVSVSPAFVREHWRRRE